MTRLTLRMVSSTRPTLNETLAIVSYFSGFDDTFDDSFRAELAKKSPKAENELRGNSADESDSVETGGEVSLPRDETFNGKVKDAFNRKFIMEVLPKLPRLPNGMVLLAAHEQSPLINCGEIYKMRLCRPDIPLSYSELFDDCCTVRFTNNARLISDECQIIKDRILNRIKTTCCFRN